MNFFTLLIESLVIVHGSQFNSYENLNINSDDLIRFTYNYREHKLDYYNGSIDSTVVSPPLSVMRILVISSSVVTKIEDNALCSSSFTEIEFIFNVRFPRLSKNHFGNCPTLISLKMIYNNMTLEETAFSNLKNLRKLELVGQKVNHLTKKIFHSLTNLKDLTMNSCEIDSIETGSFESLTNLRTLRLQKNGITRVDGVLKTLKKLQLLYLDGNKLTDFPWDDLRHVKNLEILSLTSNRLSNYNVQKLVECNRRLEGFYFRFNIFECKKVKETVADLHTQLPNVATDYGMNELKYCRHT